MNVASLELSKELFALSGWDDTDFKFYYQTNLRKQELVYCDGMPYLKGCRPEDTPAYDAGYLLRKLPKGTSVIKEQLRDQYNAGLPRTYRVATDTPEDALCKLAIKLHKQGILKSGELSNE